MSHYRSVVLGITWRTLHLLVRNPALFVPSLIFPIFFLVAFAGGLSSVGDAPGFDYPAGYTAFQFVFVLLQAAAFGGVFTGFTMAADFESGFARRMMLAAPHRSAMVAGYALAAFLRSLVTALMLFGIALLAGMEVGGGAVDLFGLLGLAALVNVAATLFGLGMALRFQSVQAAPALQIPVFLILFLAPVYVPVDLLDGWIKAVAQVNPATPLLEAGRAFLAGEPVKVGLAFAAGAALVALFAVWAVRSLRRAEAPA